MDTNEIQSFLFNYVKELHNDNSALFVGAGLSMDSGGLNWKELLREDAHSIGLDVEEEKEDLVSVAQYIYNETGSRNTISQLIKNKIKTDGKENEKHKIISSLPIKTIWTTNYDHYLENAFERTGKIVDVKKSVSDMSINTENSDLKIYKMHGDVTIPESAILIKDDYEIYDRKNEIFLNKLKADLTSKTFLFLGFSFEDPNLKSILGKVRIMLEGNTRMHYCIMKQKIRKDCKTEKEFNYQRIKENLFKNDLLRYGIKVLYINEYNDLDKVLRNIKRLYLANRIFVSGAYEDVGETIKLKSEKISADKFCEKLGKRLSEEGYIVTNALSPGVGRNLASGFINNEIKTNIIKSKFKVRPFPIYNNTKKYKKYRKSLLKECGVTIYLFGNKFDEEKNLVISDGMIKEYKISEKLGLYNLPIRQTGHAAEKIYKKLHKNNKQKKFETVDELVEDIIMKLDDNKRKRGEF
ncbi:SIR2 family protein [Mammaliicoccus fleurettii]|uniref:SIR2 family protein n=1 Tax=Mammaliicoccus fleurettii TaxID=150056 RepID=UPI000993DAFE|nr:SIR2 family protein [Mammaliicoccus fleurettii]OOV77040.1 hypothetical protein B2G86_07295 [Mammaliicoccus fleurettii]